MSCVKFPLYFWPKAAKPAWGQAAWHTCLNQTRREGRDAGGPTSQGAFAHSPAYEAQESPAASSVAQPGPVYRPLCKQSHGAPFPAPRSPYHWPGPTAQDVSRHCAVSLRRNAGTTGPGQRPQVFEMQKYFDLTWWRFKGMESRQLTVLGVGQEVLLFSRLPGHSPGSLWPGPAAPYCCLDALQPSCERFAPDHGPCLGRGQFGGLLGAGDAATGA